MKQRHSYLKRNGLSIVVLLLMLFSLSGQLVTGWHVRNQEMEEDGMHPISIYEYSVSGHFIQATFENWESEFLQMALYVLLTIKLYQVGSSESKDPDKVEEVDKDPQSSPDAPWPVRKGGLWLKIYSHSLSLSFILLFLLSFSLHFYGSLKNTNEENAARQLPPDSWQEYALSSRFWFESFQNWQSEFLSVASIVLLSIWLRQKGSPESKPVDAPYRQTGH